MRHTAGALLVVVGTMALTWAGASWMIGVDARATRAASIPPISHNPRPIRGDTIGLLQIPRLGLSVVVVEGDDASSLMLGAGHLPDTPLPWTSGNSVIAGHRDTDFSPLQHVRQGDILAFKTGNATLEYVIRETAIVEPTEVSVLRSTGLDELTLITCYPFLFVGPAPSRFIVKASRTHVIPRMMVPMDRDVKTGTPPDAHRAPAVEAPPRRIPASR